MDHEPHAARVERPFAGRRDPTVLVAVIITFLVLAVLKPWSLSGNGTESGQPRNPRTIPPSPGVASDGLPSPVATAAIVDPNGMACLSDTTDQVVILERWPGHEVRSWVAVADHPATGPLDPRLVPVPFFSSHVIGLGVCGPTSAPGSLASAAQLLDIRSIVRTADGARAVDLGVPNPITRSQPGLEPARLYGNPVATPPDRSTSPVGKDTPVATPAPWPLGAYAIQFAFPSTGQPVLGWLRIDLIRGAEPSG